MSNLDESSLSDKDKLITVVSLFAGKKYEPKYVSRLRNAVTRHLTVPHKFVCMTDRPNDIDCETVPIPLQLPGWWGKIAVFNDSLFPGRRLFIDLDTVITGRIDDFAVYGGNLAVISPFLGARDNGINSGLMNIGPHAFGYVWEKFSANPAAAIQLCYANANPPWNIGDQRWLELTINQKFDYWQDLIPGQVVSYKLHCQHGLPEDARIICFHGKPDPHEVKDAWVQENWI